MALIAALLLTMVLSTAVGGVAMIAAIERKTAAAHATGVQLRLAAQGALAIAADELGRTGFDGAVGGTAESAWRIALAPSIDVDGLSGSLQRETMMQSAHGADTPVWRLFAHAPWGAVSGQAGPAQVLVWAADDWAEADGDPSHDENGLILLRAAALAGSRAAWAEALYGRGAAGRIEVRHLRFW